MKLPQLQDADRYTGLYVVDFGDHCAVGFCAEEVAELLESERFQDIHIYKIHNACPDGRLELKGIRRDLFELESGMFFYSADEDTARLDFNRLAECADRICPPCRAKIHLARLAPDAYVTAVIYPAEYDDEMSRWLLDLDYQTGGQAEGGITAAQQYYQRNPEMLKRKQVFNRISVAFTGQNLLAAARQAIVR